MRYCCYQKCFPAPNEIVDGMACRKCRSFEFCRCLCVTYMQWMREKYCCELFCIEPANNICLLCQGLCYCLCATRQKEFLNGRTTRINGSLVELVTPRRKPEFCCPLQCFTVPDEWIRGLACWRCKAVNFCKCDCETWEARFPRARKIYGPSMRVHPRYYHFDPRVAWIDT